MLAFIMVMSAMRTDKKYVCLPCGLACDAIPYDAPGKCPQCGMDLVEENSIKFKNINFATLCERIKQNKDIVLLDVRSKEEFNNTGQMSSFGRFRNAININIQELQDRVPELNKFKDKEVVVYCSHSHRSPQASYFLTTQGFKNVENVEGGVSALQVKDGPDCLKDQYIVFPSKK